MFSGRKKNQNQKTTGSTLDNVFLWHGLFSTTYDLTCSDCKSLFIFGGLKEQIFFLLKKKRKVFKET